MRPYARVLMASLGMVAGCAPRESERADSATSPAASVSPPATPSTTPPAAPSARMEVTERGIGPLRVGMTVAEARSAVGRFDVPKAAETGCDYATATGLPAGVSVMVEKGVVVRVDVRSDSIATAEGARVGDSEQRVRSLYGNRLAVSPHKYTDGHYLTISPVTLADTLHRIVFETDKAKVTRYRAGQLPQVGYVEGCS